MHINCQLSVCCTLSHILSYAIHYKMVNWLHLCSNSLVFHLKQFSRGVTFTNSHTHTHTHTHTHSYKQAPQVTMVWEKDTGLKHGAHSPAQHISENSGISWTLCVRLSISVFLFGFVCSVLLKPYTLIWVDVTHMKLSYLCYGPWIKTWSYK